MRGFVSGYNEISIPYNYFTSDDSEGLIIVLPGAGYTVQAPLLHYAHHFSDQLHYDLLQVTYNYNDMAYDDFSNAELSEAIQYDVKVVIDAVLEGRQYTRYLLIAKSLGTIALSSELNREEFKDAKAVWLTPLIHRSDVLDAMVQCKQEGLCILGDQDPVYDQERYEKVKGNSRIECRLIAGVGHALDIEGQPLESINLLKSIVEEMDAFLVGG